jgi:hypothetical protein
MIFIIDNMTNNMKISLIKFKLARYYQLSLWILTHVSYVKKTFKKDRKLHKMESRDRVKKIASREHRSVVSRGLTGDELRV